MSRHPLAPAQIDTLCAMTAAGNTMAAVGERLGISRNAVSSHLYRLRQQGDPRVAPAGPAPTMSCADQRDALAEALAEGAETVEQAAGIAGITAATGWRRMAEIRAQLGWQAQ